MCSLDLDPCTIWRNTVRRARKHHACACCCGRIAAGQPYLDHSNLFDGNWTWEKLCASCWFAWEQFGESHGQYVAPGALWEMLQECIGANDDDEDQWRDLFAALKRRYRVSRAGRERIPLHTARTVERDHERAARFLGEIAFKPRSFVWPPSK